MNTVLEDLLLTFKKSFAVCFVEEEITIVTLTVDTFRLQCSFESFDVFCMFRHVSWKDCSHHSAFESLQILVSQVCKKIVLWLQQHLKRLRSVVRLLNTNVIIANRSYGHRIHMVWVVKTIVVIIVTSRSYQTSYLVQMIQLSNLNQSSLSIHKKKHLHYICTVQVVMISHILSISPLDFI